MLIQKGFSLVELLVTVTVVGTLAALAVAQFEEYRWHVYNMEAKVVAHDMINSYEASLVEHGSKENILLALGLDPYTMGGYRIIARYYPKSGWLYDSGTFTLDQVVPGMSLDNSNVAVSFGIKMNGMTLQTLHCKASQVLSTLNIGGTAGSNYRGGWHFQTGNSSGGNTDGKILKSSPMIMFSNACDN